MDIILFFGLPLDQDYFDVDQHANLIGLKNKMNKHKTVTRLVKENKDNPSHPIINIGKRQVILKLLSPLIEDAFLPYDALWYAKEVNTATDHDRRYGAEEKLLQYCLVAATGQHYKRLLQTDYTPNIQALRDTKTDERFKRYWSILLHHSGETIKAYNDKKEADHKENTAGSKNKSTKASSDNGSFWGKLFK